MRRIATVAATLLLDLSMAGGPAQAQTAEDAFGVWLNPENQSNVELYKCGEGLCAKITKVSDGQKTDDKNPDAAKRNRPIIGLVIMEGAKKSGANTWSGTLYNRADGKSYAGTVTVKAKNSLDLSGCVALVVCRTTTWTRVN
jgi:uncharacterized protein (DUF2147 family)